MANDCWYDFKAVSKSKDALDKLALIFVCKDKDYYIWRVTNEAAFEDKDGDFHMLEGYGEVAWSCENWFRNGEEFKGRHDSEEFPNATYTTLTEFCKNFGVAIEVYAKEALDGFQEHFVCDHEGNIKEEIADWSEEWEDEDGKPLQEPVSKGGLKDYGEFGSAGQIYG